jgi:taurine dioxygenase
MLATRPLHPTLALEIVGLGLWEKLDDATVAELRDLYARYGVLVFRRQALNEAELAAFCALFGPLERTVRSDWASPTTPEVTVLSNLKDGLGRPIGGLGDGELQWHSDQSYMMKPATGAALYAVELPSAGGETFWVDLRAAMPACRANCERQSPASATFSITRSGSPGMGARRTGKFRRKRAA